MFSPPTKNDPDKNSCELDTTVPVLVLGGKENSLSVVRHLSSHGISVACSGPSDCWGMNSRFCSARYPVPENIDPKAYWHDLLLGSKSNQQQGQIILQGSDAAIEFVAQHYQELKKRYRLEGGSAEQRLALLDKQTTLEMARAAGIGCPEFWRIKSVNDLQAIADKISYPVMVKPRDSAKFSRDMGRKLFIVKTGFDELLARTKQAIEAGHSIMIVEMIPGPDSLLSSYYTYIDQDAKPLFHFTKRIFRRFPVNRGGATFHATKWLPQTAREGLDFFLKTGFRGTGNIEFKLDPRDNKLKIIEVNARLTAAEELAIRAGMPIDLIIYRQLTGQAIPDYENYHEGLNYLYLWRDALAFMQMRQSGDLSFGTWLKSITGVKSISPLHSLADPWPSMAAAHSLAKKALKR
ncbi:hypothetical protein MNBD_ALPHA12-1278 [hydrothermal vent metagenome]|uniref:ATP-grasp domain-containing protein n=1 Tax=hydrothermal vent metagenome TaxID=652676 RepID=A0A3B0TDP4_9ZZZZ